MLFQRESGVLLHPSSFPGPYGIGEIGDSAHQWLGLLSKMEQKLWQILPITPPGTAFSPYQGRSSFAGDIMLLSFDELVRDGLLTAAEVLPLRADGGRLDFERLSQKRPPLLRKAALRFLKGADARAAAEFEAFCEAEDYWLLDYARYQAIKNARGGDGWQTWPTELRAREAEALQSIDFELAGAIRVEKALQFLFDKQWAAVRAEAKRLNIRIIGDLPIFVALDSADVWASQHLFRLDAEGQPTSVAGVPPDYFSKSGQRWGNPLYDWAAHEQEDFSWWRSRIRRTLEMTDVMRIDHFRGFAACWEIPASEPTAVNGQWVPAPGRRLFELLRQELGEDLPIIAEDLGIVTDDVVALRDEFALPTMRVLQFSFNGEARLLPDRFPENCVCYTGTHDNDTIVGWYNDDGEGNEALSAAELEAERDRVRRYYGTDGTNIHFTAIRAALETRAAAAIFPVQDVIGSGASTRVNTPGTVGPHNWSWRMEWDQLSSEAMETVVAITAETGRNRQ